MAHVRAKKPSSIHNSSGRLTWQEHFKAANQSKRYQHDEGSRRLVDYLRVVRSGPGEPRVSL